MWTMRASTAAFIFDSIREKGTGSGARSANTYTSTICAEKSEHHWLLAAGCWLLAAGCWLLATGNWQLATGNWQLATGRKLIREYNAPGSSPVHIGHPN